MKKILISLMLSMPLIAAAQTDEPAADPAADAEPVAAVTDAPAAALCIGFLSYDTVLKAMPQYADVEKQVADLRRAYEKELKRVEKDFNNKYETFLEERASYPRTIMLKRQNELQDMLQRNIEFKNKGLADLKEARQKALQPLNDLLRETIAKVASQHRLQLVLNTDGNAAPFIDPTIGEDITSVVLELLKTPAE